MEKIIIDNRDTENIHIDTHQMLTGDTHDEQTLEYLNDERPEGTPELIYDSFDWTYDHPAIVKDFAAVSIDTIQQAISNTDYAEIITNIEYLASSSPKFYNYTTDWYTATYTVNPAALAAYIESNHAAIVAIAEKYDRTICDDGIISAENMQHAAVCYILNNCITADDYNYSLWEKEYEVYSENTTYTLIVK